MSPANAIFLDRQARLFPWGFGQPERSFFLNGLLRLSGLSSASLQQEPKRFTLGGVVLRTRMANLRVFQANPKCALFPDLVYLTRKTCGVHAALVQALAPMRPKLARAYIYGSVAKQEDTAASGVDLMLAGQAVPITQKMMAHDARKVKQHALSEPGHGRLAGFGRDFARKAACAGPFRHPREHCFTRRWFL